MSPQEKIELLDKFKDIVEKIDELLKEQEKLDIQEITFGDKQYAQIVTDLKLVNDAVIATIVYYIKGYHNRKIDKGVGAQHIKFHLNPTDKGYVSLDELLNLGASLREFSKIFKKPFTDDKGGKIYEWQNNDGVRFRVAIDKVKWEGLIPPLSPSDYAIISFYSDRNLKFRMNFKNSAVSEYYKDTENAYRPIFEPKNYKRNLAKKQNFDGDDDSALNTIKAEMLLRQNENLNKNNLGGNSTKIKKPPRI